MPSDICFNCGTLSKFHVAYPELETSVEADQISTGPTITGFIKSNKGSTRNRRERKLEHRGNKLLVKPNALIWQFSLDGRLRHKELHNTFEPLAQDITDSQESLGVQAEDTQVYYDVWRDLAQEDSVLLDDDLNLHYLGHDLMASLDIPADDQSMTDIEEGAKAENIEDEDEEAMDADDEDSEYGDVRSSDGSFFATSTIVEMAQHCPTMQWEASLPVERISRKAQALFNDLCRWNFANATSCAISGAALVEHDELSPLDSSPKFSFDDGYELDRQILDRMDWARNCNSSSTATVRNRVVECRHIVGGQAYEWDILL